MPILLLLNRFAYGGEAPSNGAKDNFGGPTPALWRKRLCVFLLVCAVATGAWAVVAKMAKGLKLTKEKS